MSQKLFFPMDSDIVREQVKLGKFARYPEKYDPTDPNRTKVELQEPTTKDKIVTQKQKRKSVFDSFRQLVLGSYYDDTTSILETYHVRTNDVNMLDKVEPIAMETISKREQIKETKKARRALNFRTSLELTEYPTARTLNSMYEESSRF